MSEYHLARADRLFEVVEDMAWVLADWRLGWSPFLSWMSSRQEITPKVELSSW